MAHRRRGRVNGWNWLLAMLLLLAGGWAQAQCTAAAGAALHQAAGAAHFADDHGHPSVPASAECVILYDKTHFIVPATAGADLPPAPTAVLPPTGPGLVEPSDDPLTAVDWRRRPPRPLPPLPVYLESQRLRI